MKLSHAILVVALLCLGDVSSANTSDLPEWICQFDKSTMIKEKLKKAQECINNGNYSGAKNYLNGVLKLDPNNAKAKTLLAVCNNGGKPVASSRSNSSSSNSNTSNRGKDGHPPRILRSNSSSSESNTSNRGTSSSSTLSVSKSNLSFSSYGGTETINVSGPSWSISVNPASWGHLTRSGNTLTLKVDANSSSSARTDYFKLKSGNQEIKVNVSQSGSSHSSSPYLNVTKTELFFASEGGQESITISTNNTWKITTNTNSWGHLKQEGNTLTVSVDANYTGNQRTDYFVLSAGGVEKRINITQSQTYAKNGVSMSGSTRAYTDNATGLSYLTTCIKGWEKCRLGALTESGAGVAVYGVNGYATTGNLSSSFVAKIKELNGDKETFKSVTATSSGYFCIVYGRNEWYGSVPTDMRLKLNQYNNDREDIYCVSIAENGDFVIITDKHIYASNSTDKSNLNKASTKYGHIKYACVTNRALVVICQNGIFYSNIPTNLEVKLKSISFKPDKITFTDSGTYLITNENEAYTYRM